MMVFIDALDWPDKHFAYRQYVEGWPVIGWPADTGLYRHRPAKDMARDARDYVHPECLKRTNGDSNAILAASMMRGFRTAQQGHDSAWLASFQASYEASIKEVYETGTAEGPFDKASLDAHFGKGCWRASPSHAVWQGDPAHIGDLDYGKWRPVDDATRSKINASFRPIEKVLFPRPDFLATMARLLHAAAERDGWVDSFDVRAGADDEPQVFCNSPCSQPQYTAAVV